MPKIVGRNERGFVDPLSLFGLLFLVVTLAAVTFVTTNKNISLNISEKAGIDGGVMSPDYDLSKVLPAPVPPVVAPPPPPTNPETTSNTCDANGTQYNDGSKVIGGSDGGNSGYSKCVNGRWTDCPECTLTSLTTVPVYKQAEYLAAIKAQQKAQQEAEQIKRQEARLAQAGCNTHGGQYQFTTGMCLTTSTSQTLEKTDEGFITHSTTYVRDINTGNIVKATTTSYIAKTTTTTTQNQGNTVTTSITSYINPDTGQYYTDSTGKAIVNITGLSIIPLSDKRPTGASCTDSSECGSGSCGMQGHGRAGPPTLACLPQILSDNNYGSCNGDPTCNSALTSIDRGMNAISFGGWSNYVEAFSPDKVKYTWQESGYKSVKECQDDMIAKNNNAQAAASCNTYQITKEQATSSIKLGTTLTAEAAAIIALPGAIGAGGTAITAGATTLQVGGAVLAPALTSFGAITTLTQTSAAAVAQITDPGSPEAWKQTGYAALSWLNIGTADKLIKSFGALDAAKKAGQATESLVTAAQSARNLNNVVSGINLAVDVPNAVSTCSQAGFFTGSCGGALAAVGADIVFGTVDYKQGQLGFGNPLTKVNEGTLIGPLPDIKDPNGARIATPAEIDQINQLIANPFGATPSISNVDGEVKFTPSRQLDMFDQLAKGANANTSTVVNDGTELIFPDKPARQDPNTNFNLTKSDPNEVAAIAAFNSTDINTQGGTVAQLTPSNLNSQIPNTPITDVTAPKPVEPNANIADDITKPLTGTANTDTVDSPATTNQSPTIASLLDDPNASVLDKANGVIDTLPDTGGAISIVKKINQIGDEIAKVDVNTPKPLRDRLFGEPKTKKFSNVKTGETILIKPGDTIRTGNFETKMPKPDDYPDGIFWTKNPGDTPQRLTGEGVPITKGNSAENINFADKDGGRIVVDVVEHTTDANGRPITKPTASTAITLTDELNVQTTITRAASETGLLTLRGPDGEWFPGLKKLFGNGKPAAPTSNEAVIDPSEKLVDPETSANNSGATNNEKTVSTAEELFDHFKKEYKSELPENLVVHKDPNDFYSFQQELIDAAKNGEVTNEFLAQKMKDLQGRGNVTFVIKDPGEINDISGGIAYTQKVLNPKTGKYEITVFLPSPANLAEYKNIDIEPARIKIAELIGHEAGHAYDEVGLSAIGVNPNSSGGLWATEYLQQNFSNEFQKALGVENPVKDGFVKGVEAQANIVKNTSGEPLPATKRPSALAAWWDSTVVKPLGDIIFGKKPIFLDNLDTPLTPIAKEGIPTVIKPTVEMPVAKIPYSKDLDPLIEVKNAWNKYGDRLTTAYNNKDVQGLIDIAKENGYQVKIVPFGEKVDIVEIGGKTTKMPMTKADTVRIGKSGGKKTLFIATTDVSNPTFKIDDLAHDIGAVITDVKFIPIEKIDISPYSFADFMTRATGEKWNASDIAKNFGTQLNGRTKSVEVPITYIVDALTFGEVPSNFLESVPVKITIPQKFTNWWDNIINPKVNTTSGLIPTKGTIEISKLHPHEFGYNPKTVDELTSVLEKSRALDPVKITEYNGQFYTYDGANRITAYVQSGQDQVPYIFTEFNSLSNLDRLVVETASTGNYGVYKIPAQYGTDFPVSPVQSTHDTDFVTESWFQRNIYSPTDGALPTVTTWVKVEMAKTNPNAFKNIGQDITTTFDNLKNGFELRSPIGTDGKLQLPFEKVTLPKNIEPEIDLNKLEVKDVPSWENVKNKEVATVIDVENIDSIPPLKGRDFIPQVKPVRELYPVEIVNNLFFSEKSADSGRKLVQDYLQALKNGEDISEYQKIAKSFLNAQEKVYDTQSQSANSKLASWISRNYKGVDVNSLPTENIDDLALVRVMSSPDPIGVDPYGNVVIQSTFLGNPQKDAESVYRTSKHFTVNGAVAPVQTAYGRVADWSAGDVIVITPMNEFIKINGTPNTFAVQDTWWTPGTYDNLVLPKGTVLIIKDGSEALKEYANLPGVLIIKSENPYRSSRGVLEELGYQYKAQGTEYSEPNTPEEVFLNESVFAYNIGANSGLHFDSPTMNVGNELSTRLLTDETINHMSAWSEGNLSRHQRLNTVVDLIQDGYFSHKPINGLYIPPERIPNSWELTPDNFDGFTSPLTNSQIKAVEDIISNEKLTLPNYWENQGVIAEYQQLIKDSFVDPTLSSGLPLLKPDIFGLTNEDTNFLRQNVNELTKTTIPVSEKLVTENLDAADNTIKLNETPEQSKPTIFGFELRSPISTDGKLQLPFEKTTVPNIENATEAEVPKIILWDEKSLNQNNLNVNQEITRIQQEIGITNTNVVTKIDQVKILDTVPLVTNKEVDAVEAILRGGDLKSTHTLISEGIVTQGHTSQFDIDRGLDKYIFSSWGAPETFSKSRYGDYMIILDPALLKQPTTLVSSGDVAYISDQLYSQSIISGADYLDTIKRITITGFDNPQQVIRGENLSPTDVTDKSSELLEIYRAWREPEVKIKGNISPDNVLAIIVKNESEKIRLLELAKQNKSKIPIYTEKELFGSDWLFRPDRPFDQIGREKIAELGQNSTTSLPANQNLPSTARDQTKNTINPPQPKSTIPQKFINWAKAEMAKTNPNAFKNINEDFSNFWKNNVGFELRSPISADGKLQLPFEQTVGPNADYTTKYSEIVPRPNATARDEEILKTYLQEDLSNPFTPEAYSKTVNNLIENTNGPLIEVGGPSLQGFRQIDLNTLEKPIIVTNIEKGLPVYHEYTGIFLGYTGKVDRILDATSMDLPNESVGAFIGAAINENVMPKFLEEGYRTLEPGGMIVLDTTTLERVLPKAKDLGFRVIEESRNPVGSINLTLQKPPFSMPEVSVAQTAAEAKPNLFGLEWKGFTNSEGNFTLWPLEKITTPNPPIKSGEVFDPNIEIKNILKSPNRTEALADFKTKLAYQQKGMAKIQTELEKTILNNPAVTFDELTSQVNSLSKTYGLSNTQMGKLEDALTIYQERTTRISELLSDYPDKNDLFQAMFGKKPVGRIEISQGPISIHIKAYNAEDYGYLGNRDFTDPAIPTNTNDANTSGGFFKPSGTLLPDTEGIIIVENNTKWYYKFFAPDVVGIHEDQHALNNLLKQADIYPAPLSGYSDSYYNLQEALELGDNKLINTSLQNYLDRVKTSANYNVMDEMLAMLKDGTSNSTITKYITQPKNNGGIYDFYGRRKEEVTKIFDTEDLAANKSIQEIIDQNLGTNASKTVINNGLKAFDNLLSKGYTRDEALALLEKTALSDWPKVSERAPIPNFVTRTTSYISGKIVTPTNLAHFQTPSNYLMAGGIIYQVYNINKIVNLASNFGWDNTGALLKDWWQDRNPFSSTLPTSETPTGDEKVSESSLINVINPPPAIPPVIPDSPAKTNEQQKLELERQAKIKSGLYAQIDADLATQTILGGAGKPFKNIGCGQVAVANILCEYGNYCPTPIQIANQIPLKDYGTTGLTSSQSNIKILNENGFTTDPYTKSLQYHLTDYMEPTDVLWISGIVGGIDHHTYINGYTLDKNGIAIYNLNDSYFGDGYKCKTSGDSSFSCDNPDGSHINIGAENANIYIIDTNI